MLDQFKSVDNFVISGSEKSKELIDGSLSKVSLEDLSDCAKKLICELQTKEELVQNKF